MTNMLNPKNKNRQQASQADHFARLPDELLLSIISLLDDLKQLFQCSLVSKRFASITFCVQSVSITLSSPGTYPAELSENHSNEDIPEPQPCPIKELNFSLFLENFKEVKSIRLDMICPVFLSGFPLTKWKAKYRDGQAGVESMVCLAVSSVIKKNESGPTGPDQDPLLFVTVPHLRDSVFQPLKCCMDFVFIVNLLARRHRSLESIVIKDTDGKGNMVVRDGHLVEWRKDLARPGGNYVFFHNPSMCWLPELRLPVSGHVLKGVCFAVIKCIEGNVGGEVGDVARWEYEGEEEKVLGEAAREIVAKHMDRFFTFLRLHRFRTHYPISCDAKRCTCWKLFYS